METSSLLPNHDPLLPAFRPTMSEVKGGGLLAPLPMELSWGMSVEERRMEGQRKTHANAVNDHAISSHAAPSVD